MEEKNMKRVAISKLDLILMKRVSKLEVGVVVLCINQLICYVIILIQIFN